MENMYRRGRIAEARVANYLRERGFENVRRSAGSRTPADLYGVRDGRKHYIQVKYNTAKETPEERAALQRLAKQRGGNAAVIYKKPNGIRWKFLGNY
jgi:Holliday junction resolvase